MIVSYGQKLWEIRNPQFDPFRQHRLGQIGFLGKVRKGTPLQHSDFGLLFSYIRCGFCQKSSFLVEFSFGCVIWRKHKICVVFETFDKYRFFAFSQGQCRFWRIRDHVFGEKNVKPLLKTARDSKISSVFLQKSDRNYSTISLFWKFLCIQIIVTWFHDHTCEIIKRLFKNGHNVWIPDRSQERQCSFGKRYHVRPRQHSYDDFFNFKRES